MLAGDNAEPDLWWPIVVEEVDIIVTTETRNLWVGTKPMRIIDAGSEALHQLQRLEEERRLANERPDGG